MNMIFNQGQVRTPSPGMIVICGQVLTGTGGAISGTPLIYGGGASIVKTAATTGRYTITIAPPTGVSLSNLILMHASATIIGPDTAALTAGKGTKAIFRRDDISQTSVNGTSAKDGTIELQFTRNNGTTDDNDTELQDAAAFTFLLIIGTVDVV